MDSSGHALCVVTEIGRKGEGSGTNANLESNGVLLMKSYVSFFLALSTLSLAACASDASDDANNAEDDLSASTQPGPVCSGAALTDARIVDLITSGARTTFRYPVITPTEEATRIGSMQGNGGTYWSRKCRVSSGRKSCDAWKAGGTTGDLDAGVYLASHGGTYTAALYGAKDYSIFSDGIRWEGTAFIGAAGQSLSQSKLIGFQTTPLHYYRSSNVAGQYDESVTVPLTGTVRSKCAKFWSIKKENEVVSGSASAYTESAQVFFATY